MHSILNRIYRSGMVVLKEPLFQFMLIGAVIFAVSEVAAGWKDDGLRIISIDSDLEHYLENLYSAQFGARPETETLDHLINNYIREEVMYREALRLGLAEQDEIIRRRLIQKMEFLLTDSTDVSEPDAASIRTFYELHADEFTIPARVSFRHLYFSDDNQDTITAEQRAGNALSSIQSGRFQEAAALSDKFQLNDHYVELDQREARQLFGQSQLIQGLFDAQVGRWSGPFQSGYGWHLILVEQRNENLLQPLDEVRDKVISAWRLENSTSQFESVLRDLMGRYQVRRNGGDKKG